MPATLGKTLMIRSLRCAVFVAMGALGGVAAGQAPLPPPPPLPAGAVAADAGEDVDRAAAACAAGDPRGARRLLLDLLRREGPSEALAPHARRIDGLLREAQFAQSWREPAPRELPGGKVGAWKETSGLIGLRYARDTTVLDPPSAAADPALAWLSRLADQPVVPMLMLPAADHLVAASGVLVHQADFGDECSIEIKGDLPEDECSLMPHVFLCIEEVGHYDLALTWPRYPASPGGLDGGGIVGRQGLARRLVKGLVVEEHPDPNPIEKYGMKKRRAYAVVVKLKRDEIFFSINGVAGPRIPRDPAAKGLLGYTAFPRVSLIEVSGAMDRAWLGRLAQARRGAARAQFDAEPPVDREVPDWWPAFVASAAPAPGG